MPSTPKRMCLPPASSNPNNIDWTQYQYCPSPWGSYFHAPGISCPRCCDICRIGWGAWIQSGLSREFWVTLCTEHYKDVYTFVCHVGTILR